MMLTATTTAAMEATREFTFAQPGWLWELKSNKDQISEGKTLR